MRASKGEEYLRHYFGNLVGESLRGPKLDPLSGDSIISPPPEQQRLELETFSRTDAKLPQAPGP